MRIIRLNEESRQDILANLLKRDPNNYIGYEDKVREIVENVKKYASDGGCGNIK